MADGIDIEKLQQELQEVRGIVAQLQVHNPNVIDVPPRSPTVQSQIFPAPEKFSFKKEEWESWSKHYERFRLATKMDQMDQKIQINNLLLHMGIEVNKVLDTLQRKEESFNNYNDLKGVLDEYYIKKTNVIYERAKFNLRSQRENETAREYIDNIITLAKTCNYGNLIDELIRDRLVVGIRDQKLSEILQMDENLNLEKAINKIAQSETVKLQNIEIRKANEKQNHIDYVKKNRTQKDRKFDKKKSNYGDTKKNKNVCRRCGSEKLHKVEDCPAMNARCKRCNYKGHFIKQCKTKQIRYLKNEEMSEGEESSEESSETEVAEIININEVKSKSPPWMIHLKIEKKDIPFKVDTGADESIMSLKTYNKLRENYKLTVTDTILVGPDHNRLKTVGRIIVPVRYSGKIKKITMFVLENTDNLLGRPAINTLDILKWNKSNQLGVIGETKQEDEWLKEVTSENITQKIKERYTNLFKGVGKVKGVQCELKVREDAVPVSVNTPRRVPIQLLEKVRLTLRQMQEDDVIVPVVKPTEWCSPMVVVNKGNGKVRICTDFTKLNLHIVREQYLLPSVEETLAKLQNVVIMSKLDCSSGFWQLQLSKESQKYTTFITPFGRFKYRRLPFGISVGPEIFQRVLSDIVNELKLQNIHVHADDILVTGQTVKEHNSALEKLLKLLTERGITLNLNKCEFAKTELKYLGYVIGTDGIKPDQDSISAIVQYKQPTNKTELRRFLGMVNYLTKFIKGHSDKTSVLRELLNEKNDFMWSDKHEHCFNNLKKDITSVPVLAMYNPNLEIRVSADSSAYGVGGVLEQKQQTGEWKPVYYCSKTLTETQRRYAQIEKECLSILHVCERLQQFLIGKSFHICTDHKPLVTILKTKDLNELSIRLQRMRMRLMKFNYTIEYIPGKEFYTADALSRAPTSMMEPDSDVLHENCETLYINLILNESSKLLSKNLEEILNKQIEDDGIKQIKNYVMEGWPEKCKVVSSVSPYYKYRYYLHVSEGIVCYKDRLLIPAKMRKQCLHEIHLGHQGLNKSKRRAKMAVWWPGINRELENLINECEKCLKHKAPSTEPLLQPEMPCLPWKTVVTDLCEYNNNTYLIIQDCYSKFPEMIKLYKTSSKAVIEELKKTFARYGIPDVVRSDNGPQFDSTEFRDFAQQYKFKWISSSPHHAQSNGQAENAVKLVKNILKKSEDVYLGLLAYRNTPLECGFTPAQLLMGRNLKEVLPIQQKKLKPAKIDHRTAYEKMKMEKKRQKQDYDKRHRVKPCRSLQEKERVWITDKKSEGRVMGRSEEPRSYKIQTDKGVIRRNRKFLQPLPAKDSREEKKAQVHLKEREKRLSKRPNYLEQYVV